MKANRSVELWGWCTTVFVAAFMPWGAVGTTSLFGISVSSIITGWSGYTTVLGIIVPNWMVVICALAIASLYWLNASGRLETGSRISQLLAGYSIVHATLFIYSILTYGGSRIGVGAVVTLAAFIAILRSLRKNPQPVAAPPSASTLQPPQGHGASSSQKVTKQLSGHDT